jgi:hypothetical protein
MRQHRLVTRFLPVRKTAVSTLKRLNEFQSIPHESSEWKIYVSTGKNLFMPEGTMDIANDIMFNRLPRQKIVLFESDTEAYAAICQDSFIPQMLKVAAINDSEKTMAFVRQLAPKG